MVKFSQNLMLILKEKTKLIFLFSITLLFCGCNGSYPPVEADDFGYPKYTIYAQGQNVTGQEGNQLADWELTGYKFNGDIITIMVYNPSGTSYVWGPWLCGGEEDLCPNMTTAPYCIDSTSTCTYGPDYCPMSSTAGFCCSQDETACQDVMYESFPNAPCILQQGQGLYLLITNPLVLDTYGNNPNTYPTINRQPYQAGFYTKGLWYPSNAYQNNEPAMGYNGNLTIPDGPSGAIYPSDPNDYIGGYAYLKIVDRYYDDNSGYMYASLKTGFDQIIPPPIDTVISFLTTALDNTAETIFVSLINESDFRASLKALLVMYIVVHGIMYMGGLIEMSQRDLASMSIRLIIVIQLLTTSTSWDLFNTYFFNFFTSGLNEMITIVTSNLPGSGEFSFFDSLLGLLFSYETNVKIYALIASFPCGILVTIMIYIAFAIFILAIAQSVMIYLLAYMAIDLLIIVAPIFISFMLFETTKSLFENWINLFCSYFLQAVVVMAALSLLGQIIVNQIYLILGFEACYNDWITVDYSGTKFVISKTWQICPFFDQMAEIAVPGYGYNDPNDPTYYCDPYECSDVRYVDLPFLDTDSEASLIDDFRNAPGTNDLNTPMLYNGSILIITCYLMMKFNEITPKLGRGLSGGSFSSAIGSVGMTVTKDIGAAASGFKNAALKISTGKSQAEREKAMRMKYQMLKRKTLTSISENVVDPLKRNVIDPATQAASSAANYTANLAGQAATAASAYVGDKTAKGYKYLSKSKDSILESVTGKDKQQRQKLIAAPVISVAKYVGGKTAKGSKYISKSKDSILESVTKMNKQQRQKLISDNFTISKENREILKGAAQSALNIAKKAATSTASTVASGSMKAAGSIYNSAKATAPKSIYSLGGFIKDMIIPPGSLMGFDYSPKAAADYKRDFLAARNKIKARDAQEEKDTYDKFHETRKEKYFGDELKPIKERKEALDEEFNKAYSAKANRLKRDLNENEMTALQAKFKDRYEVINDQLAAIDKKYKAKFPLGVIERLEYDPKNEGYKYEKSHRENLVDMFKKNVKLGGVSLAEIEERAAEFDRRKREEYGDSLSMTLLKAGIGGLAKATLSKETLGKIDKMKKDTVKAIREALLDPAIKEKEAQAQREKLANRQAKKERTRLYKAEKLKTQQNERELKKQQEKEQRDLARQARRSAKFAAKISAEEEKLMRGAGKELKEKFRAIRGRSAELAQKGDEARAASQARANKPQGAFVGDPKFVAEMAARRKRVDESNDTTLAQKGDEARAASQAKANKPQGEFVGEREFAAKMAARRKKADHFATEGLGTASPIKKESYTYVKPASNFPINVHPVVTKAELGKALAKRTKTSEELTKDIDDARAKRIKPKNINPLESALQNEIEMRKSAKRTNEGNDARETSIARAKDRIAEEDRNNKFKQELSRKVKLKDLVTPPKERTNSLFKEENLEDMSSLSKDQKRERLKKEKVFQSKEAKEYLFLDEKEKSVRKELFGDSKKSSEGKPLKKPLFEDD